MTQQSNKNELKGYKVTNVDRTRKFGIACKNLQELKRKSCAKFNIPNEEQNFVTICLVDGSQINDDDYFFTLEPQTTLILQRKGEKLLSDADILYNTLRQVNLEFITTGDKISKFLSENLKSKVFVLNKALNKDDSKTNLSSRDEHPDWFKQLETTANTKEAYMHRRCQDRIRCYLYKTIDQIKNSEIYIKNEKARRHLTNAISFFKLQLREDHCFGYYFDRSYAKVCKNPKAEKLKQNSSSSSSNNKEKEEEEEEEEQGNDELDSVFNCRYDHCPCKIKFDFNSHKSAKIILSQLFRNDYESNASDELDARKVRSYTPSKKLKINDNDDDDDDDDDDDEAGGDFIPNRIKSSDNVYRLALCDNNGEFHCDGIWNADRCAYGDRHCINPYRSYEELVLFSTWNFDHRIERSRTLIPNLLKASEQDKISQKDIKYYYDNIFTVKNLRLVHIICHDKGAHKQ